MLGFSKSFVTKQGNVLLDVYWLIANRQGCNKKGAPLECERDSDIVTGNGRGYLKCLHTSKMNTT